MADVDGYLAICGPPFLSQELMLEQLADHQTLQNLVVESDRLACFEDTHVETSNLHSVNDWNQQQQTQREFAEASIAKAALDHVPVTHGRGGLCYDVNQVSDSRLRNRLLKNRESADQSRKRKRETMKRDELLLEELKTENERLKDDNAALLNRIAEMEARCLPSGRPRPYTDSEEDHSGGRCTTMSPPPEPGLCLSGNDEGSSRAQPEPL
jgi:hypothetical protein